MLHLLYFDIYPHVSALTRILFGLSVDSDTKENVVLIYRIRHTAQRYLEGLDVFGETEKPNR